MATSGPGIAVAFIDRVGAVVGPLVLFAATLVVCRLAIGWLQRRGVLYRVVGVIVVVLGLSMIGTGVGYSELELGQSIMFAGVLGPVFVALGVALVRADARARRSTTRAGRVASTSRGPLP